MSVTPPVVPVAPVPAPAPAPSRAKKVLRALVAAVGSTDAVKAEKSLAVLIAARLLLSAGASVGVVDIVSKVIQNL